MASLVLGTIGASIGSGIGGTFLGMSASSIGFMAGSTLGNWLFPPEGMHTQGSRISDLSVQSGARGAAIPKVYGTSRIAGNVLWSAGLVETANTQSSGGKGGGGGSSHTSYTYSASFAIGLCEGPITGIRRIWADSVLIYNKGTSATSDELAISDQTGITIYTGSEDQEADPLMEADKGSGNVPAYKGLAYIVFDTLQLEKYGNRIPNITCEVVNNGSTNLLVSTSALSDNLITLPSYSTSELSIGYKDSLGFRYGIEKDGTASWNLGAGLYPDLRLFKIDTADNSILEDGTLDSAITDPDYRRELVTFLYTDENIAALSHNYGDSVRFIDLDNKVSLGDYTKNYGINKFYNRSTRIARSNGHTYYFSINGNKLDVVKATSGYTPSSNIYSRTFSSAGFGFNFNYDDTFSIVDYGTTGVTTTATLYRYSNTGSLLSQVDVTFESGVSSNTGPGGSITLPSKTGNKIVFISGYNYKMYLLNETTGYAEEIHTFPVDAVEFLILAEGNDVSFDLCSYNSTSSANFSSAQINSVVASGTDTLADIISDLCNEARLVSIDVSNVLSTVKGFTRTKPMTIKSALIPLLDAYQLTAVESDYQLKFIHKDGSVDETVSSDELNAVMNDPDRTKNNDPLKITKEDETTLPRRIVTEYIAGDSDYLVGVQQAQRIYNNG